MDKLFSHPKTFEENPILQNLKLDIPISDKPKNTKSCDEVFYEYLKTFKDKTNEKEKEAINNKKEPYYRIEKLPKEDKGKKGKKNLFLNDSLKGSSFQATIKK